MTKIGETIGSAGPDGSIFLPNDDKLTLPELDKLKFAVIQLRGDYSELTPDEQMQAYKEIVAAEEILRARNADLGCVALSAAV